MTTTAMMTETQEAVDSNGGDNATTGGVNKDMVLATTRMAMPSSACWAKTTTAMATTTKDVVDSTNGNNATAMSLAAHQVKMTTATTTGPSRLSRTAAAARTPA